jgi:beta-lactamase regulating signal transducer with metallopeptidase domain
VTGLSGAITTALLHSLWQDALIAAAIAIVISILGRSRANGRYLVACAGLALMVAIPVWTAATTYRQMSATSGMRDAVSTGAGAISPVYSQETAARPMETPVTSSWPARVTRAAQVWALPLWMAGVLLFSVRGVFASTQVWALRGQGENPDETTAAMVACLASRLGIERPLQVLMVAAETGPATLGWLRPVILLPPAAALGLTTQQLEALVMHELAHIRRHDCLVSVAQLIAETLFFYHPAIWYVSRRIRLERELCCDDIVVASCGDALGYARALTKVARVRIRGSDLAMAARGGALVHRIQRLLQPQPLRRRTVSRWPAVLTLAAVVSMATTIGARWFEQHAQRAADTGAIWGYVYDPLGERAAGITITLDNNVIDNGKGPFGPPMVLATKTDALGHYRFENVRPGAYVLAPDVAWAKSKSVWVRPSGTAQNDIWVAFDTVATAIFVNTNTRGPARVVETPSPRAGAVTGPAHVRRSNLPFPAGLRLAGDVIVEGHIGLDGQAHGIRVVSATDPELARAALSIVSEERWEPARVRGAPLEVPLRVTVVFRLGIN